MAIVKIGSITGTGSAINLNLGFVPSRIRLVNQTNLAAQTGVAVSEWYYGMTNAYGLIQTLTAGAPVYSQITSNGFTPYKTADSALWKSTNLTITGISQAAQATVTATNRLAAGDVVTFSGVKGMTQINTLRGVVVSATGSNFVVNIDTSAFTAWSSGGIANVIASSSSTYAVTPTNGLPAQANVGQIGITLGTGVAGSASDVIYYEAYLDTDVTSA